MFQEKLKTNPICEKQSDTKAGKLAINGQRLWDSLLEMATIGPGIAGGNNRQTLTDEDAAARTLFTNWCSEAGMTVSIDQVGNIFAYREGADPTLSPVYMGSHLDTQPTGGKYDGVLGVLGGLEVIRTLNDYNITTQHPIVLTNWTNEEGTRFAPVMLGSGVFAGKHTLAWAYDRTDAEGKTFYDELKRIGWIGEEEVGQRNIHAMFELHIEQGPILEAENKDIGVVTHGQGLRWIECTVTGKESHTGSTPMPMRKNAGRGLACITELVHDIAMKHQPNAVGAIGHIDVYPNSRNIILGKVVFTVDFRSHVIEIIEAMVHEFEVKAPALCETIGVKLDWEIVGQFNPPASDKQLTDSVRNVAQSLGYSHMDIVSGAGHDACWINEVAPTTMIMCPCVDGLSHNEAEEIKPQWATAGTNVLLHSVLHSAKQIKR